MLSQGTTWVKHYAKWKKPVTKAPKTTYHIIYVVIENRLHTGGLGAGRWVRRERRWRRKGWCVTAHGQGFFFD